MVRIFRIEYETESVMWKVNIAAVDVEDAKNLLINKIGVPFKITSISDISTLDVITDKSKNELIKPTKSLKCPFCDKTDFKSKQGLKVHIAKVHKSV